MTLDLRERFSGFVSIMAFKRLKILEIVTASKAEILKSITAMRLDYQLPKYVIRVDVVHKFGD